MRIFSLLALVMVLAIVMIQYKNNVQQVVERENQRNRADEVEKQVNQAVVDYQKKLHRALDNSAAD